MSMSLSCPHWKRFISHIHAKPFHLIPWKKKSSCADESILGHPTRLWVQLDNTGVISFWNVEIQGSCSKNPYQEIKHMLDRPGCRYFWGCAPSHYLHPRWIRGECTKLIGSCATWNMSWNGEANEGGSKENVQLADVISKIYLITKKICSFIPSTDQVVAAH